MKPVIQTPSFAVYDDVLQAPAFDRIWQYVQREKYTWVHHQMWLKAWRLTPRRPRRQLRPPPRAEDVFSLGGSGAIPG